VLLRPPRRPRGVVADRYPQPMPRYPTRRATSAGGVVCDDSPDGRRWAVKDNLLVIAVDSVGELPESVQLQGSAKSRTLETSLFQ
jgi:hypothetical protein